jgi:hypothetical protein
MVDPEARARFVYLVVRELGATGVRVQEGPGDAADNDPRVVRVELGGSRAVEATFDTPPKERADAQRRLLLLARAFEGAIFDAPGTHTGNEPERALNEELGALAGRAGAVDVLVIDARSPVVWGSARGLLGMHPTAEVVRIGRPRRSAAHAEPPTAKRRAERVIARVRTLHAMGTLHRGGHLAHLERGRSGGFLARSFAGIYVIVVLFDTPIDELRSERALREHLPAIERFILALPPREPEGGAKVVSLRAKRARRG